MLKTYESKLNTPLFEVQYLARKKAKKRKGFNYYMEQGLGKSLTMLDEFAEWLTDNEVDGLIVSCPPSLIENWVNEAKQHGLVDRYGVNCYMWDVNCPKLPDKIQKPFLLVVNYEAVGHEGYRCEDYLERVSTVYRCAIGLDEAVYIKNPKSLRSRACLRLRKRMVYRRNLSGLPAPQGPQDYWSQFLFIDAIPPTRKFTTWKSRYCEYGGYNGGQVVGTKNEGELNALIQENSFVALKRDWFNLPKLFSMRQVVLTDIQKRHYRDIEQDFITTIAGKDVSVDMAASKWLKLQQISSGFIIDNSGNPILLPGGSGKLKVVKEIMEETRKILIPVYFNFTIDHLKEELKEFNPMVIRGGMKADEIEEEKLKFNKTKDCRIGILQEQAAKYGHTLVGSPEADLCYTTVFYENTYSLDDRSQIEDRTHRYGQKNSDGSFYIDMACSPVERAVLRSLQRKKSMSDAVLRYQQTGEVV